MERWEPILQNCSLTSTYEHHGTYAHKWINKFLDTYTISLTLQRAKASSDIVIADLCSHRHFPHWQCNCQVNSYYMISTVISILKSLLFFLKQSHGISVSILYKKHHWDSENSCDSPRASRARILPSLLSPHSLCHWPWCKSPSCCYSLVVLHSTFTLPSSFKSVHWLNFKVYCSVFIWLLCGKCFVLQMF